MSKKIGLFWLKDDFRLKKNLALSEVTNKHEEVVAFYLYKKNQLDNQTAQKWWIGKSLIEFKNKLSVYNINLEIIKIETYKSFFENLFKKKNFSIYWNKTYEPNFIKFDKFLSKNFAINQVDYKIFKGNILNEIDEVKKADGTPFKVFTPYWRNAEKFYYDKIPINYKKILKCKNKVSFFKNTFEENKILPKKILVYKISKILDP